MAGSSMTFTETTFSTVKKIKAVWTSDDSNGTASATTSKVYNGRFIGLITDPRSPSPNDNYTVTVKDGDGVDLLLGAATTNRDTANTEFLAEASLAGVANSTLVFAIAAAGNSKQGTIYLLIR